jgi:hypothetical protein
MAQWRLGHKDEARAWFDKAAAWMDKHKPKDGELARYRAEAAGLLGLSQASTANVVAEAPPSH